MSHQTLSGIFQRPEIMWLKFVCIAVIASGAVAKQDELLDELYGLEGRNRMAICVRTSGGRWRHCDGALYNREWVVARALCLGAAPSAAMAAERVSAGGSCRLAAGGDTGLYRSRAVRHHVMHPWFDLAIVIMKTPYNNLDRLANATKSRLKLRRHGVYKWMKHYFDAFALTRNYDYNMKRIARSLKTYHHPIWYFFTTMVLPSVLFMMFFVYVTFYTGKTQEVPYKQLRYSKKITHV